MVWGGQLHQPILPDSPPPPVIFTPGMVNDLYNYINYSMIIYLKPDIIYNTKL